MSYRDSMGAATREPNSVQRVLRVWLRRGSTQSIGFEQEDAPNVQLRRHSAARYQPALWPYTSNQTLWYKHTLFGKKRRASPNKGEPRPRAPINLQDTHCRVCRDCDSLFLEAERCGAIIATPREFFFVLHEKKRLFFIPKRPCRRHLQQQRLPRARRRLSPKRRNWDTISTSCFPLWMLLCRAVPIPISQQPRIRRLYRRVFWY
jgi:hypothetical protein